MEECIASGAHQRVLREEEEGERILTFPSSSAPSCVVLCRLVRLLLLLLLGPRATLRKMYTQKSG